MSEVLFVIGTVIHIYSFILLGRVLMSWIPMFTNRPLDPSNPLVKILLDVTEPVLAPLRRYLMIGMIDLSPLVALIGLQILGNAILSSA
ncbi:MAG: YggT family protein [Chloroflexi bacterium]|nr:YggT family protein [Chloroflexota bacterium]MDE2894170.1 YggT family protein [Chloroflexota bacterium]MDE2988410.1 YggT family protein [Chloroflexota bacterium]MXV81687.1 YggT family protein [Chloroflexota bacterium]MXX48929.1 YggT family protein [Chloroflexota bacterium]